MHMCAGMDWLYGCGTWSVILKAEHRLKVGQWDEGREEVQNVTRAVKLRR
jgi:hypothetical protein